MSVARRWIGAVLLAAGILGMASPARAVSLWSGGVGGSVSVDGLTITVNSCSLTLAGVAQTDCSFANAELVVVASPSGAEVMIDGLGGTALFTATGDTGLYDMTVTLKVTAASSKTTVSNVGATLTGSESASNRTALGQISMGEGFSGVSGAHAFNLNMNQLPSGSYSGTVSGGSNFTAIHPATSSFSVTKDLRLNDNSKIVASTDTLILQSVTQLFTPAPEPLSIGVFLVGVGGLAAARRRRNR